MPMPKGHKKEHGYGSSKALGGLSYHDIAKEMNKKDYKMNHSTARNLFVSGLTKIANNICDLYQRDLNKKELKKIAIDPRFQEAVSEFMKEIKNEK